MTMRNFTLCAAAAALALTLAGCSARPKPAPPAPPATQPAPVAAAKAGPAQPTAAGQPTPDPDAATMPTDTGKQDVVTLCTGCHTLHRVVTMNQSRADWASTLKEMQDNGLSATPAELARVLDYLAKHYPAQPAVTARRSSR